MFHLRRSFLKLPLFHNITSSAEYSNQLCISCQNIRRKNELSSDKRCYIAKRTLSNNVQVNSDTVIQSPIYDNSIFKALSESAPVEFLQNSLIGVHNFTGLPWWATIICTTVVLRSAITLPLAIHQKYVIAKLELLKYEMNDLVKELKKETAIAVKMYNWDEKTARRIYNKSLRTQWNRLIVRDNCHPFKISLLMLVQIPLWISLTMSMRNLIYMQPCRNFETETVFIQFCNEGIGWISNLTQFDPTFVLPVVFGLTNLALIELMVLSKITVPTTFQKVVTNVFRGFSIILIPLCTSMPSGIILYWTASSIFGLVQNIVLMSPRVKRFCKIPATPSELEQPYKQVGEALKMKLNFLQKNKREEK